MSDMTAAIEKRRAAEKEQALFYRTLAAAAEDAGDEDLAQRFQGLHADEQHHLSRFTARLVELGVTPADLGGTRPPAVELAGWERIAREREQGEVLAYEGLLVQTLDDRTRELVRETLAVERHHATELGGKWTLA